MRKSGSGLAGVTASHFTMSAFPVPDVVQGHVGHLSKSQAAALATFKANLEKAGLYQPDPPSHDEPTLL